MMSLDRARIQGLHRGPAVNGGTVHGIGSRVRGAARRSYKSQLNADWVLDIFYGGSYGIDAPGAAGGPDLYVQKDGFRETFCADVPVDMADVMFATQRPLSAAALNENATAAGWKSKPSWFLISKHDNAISPDAERFMAQRMRATTETIDGSHTAFIAKPVAVATFIGQALQ